MVANEVVRAERQLMVDMHKTIKGVGFDGQRYSALSPEPYAWVWATFYPSYLGQLRHYHRMPVTRAVEEQLYAEMKQVARILGTTS